MLFFLDLDNTIARRNMTHFAHACNECDDRYLPLLEALHRLQTGEHIILSPEQCQNMARLLQEHLRLVTFHADTIPAECYGLRVLPLASWKDFDPLFVSLGPSSLPTALHT